MEDERQVEIDCISAIFPEIVFDPDDPFSASIELPVNPTAPVKVVFPHSSDGPQTTALPTPPPSAVGSEKSRTGNPLNLESHQLTYLPALQLRISLPEGYPEEHPPKFELSTSPPWLSRTHLDDLQAGGETIWEEAGHSSVVYGYIDSLQQAAENAFGFAEEGKVLEIPLDFRISLLDYDIKATQAAFDKETFDCGICLDPKKGSACHRMVDCGHVSCVQCLQDFYNNAIKEGDLATVRCLDPDCAKKRSDAQGSTPKGRKIQLSPSELLQIPLEHEMVTRYVKLKHKADLESDKNTIYCPRKWCQGAARSKKHRKPDGFEDIESEDESEMEETANDRKELLAVCEDCSFAFCSRCFQGWHGEFVRCTPPRDTGELTEEEKASQEYIKLHTTPCPTCDAPAQKTHGCNHMICRQCRSHFCYLCSAWLVPANPYKHYNADKTPCFMRLWDLEGGDGDDVGIGYVGGIAIRGGVAVAPEPEDAVAAVHPPAPLDDAANAIMEEPIPVDLAHRRRAADPDDEAEPAADAPPPQALQREGPLVLRINQVPQRPAPAPAVPDPPRPAPRNRGPRQPNANQAPRPGVPRRGGRGGLHPRQPAQGQQERVEAEQEAAQQAWVQRFVQMALNDEEDQLDWDSNDEEDAAWDIPIR